MTPVVSFSKQCNHIYEMVRNVSHFVRELIAHQGKTSTNPSINKLIKKWRVTDPSFSMMDRFNCSGSNHQSLLGIFHVTVSFLNQIAWN